MAAKMAKILIIEDEEKLAGYMQLWLEQVGYRCEWCGAGTAGLKRATEWQPDLVILDLALPEMDGWQVCRRLRQASQVPIIMVTARGEEIDRVRGLTMGADDYIVKPCSFPELVARVEAVLRRTRPRDEPADRAAALLHAEGLAVDVEAHKAWLDGQEIRLTPTEFRLLAYMMSHQGRLLTHREILQAVWGQAYGDDVDSLRMCIRALRHKIESPSPGPDGANGDGGRGASGARSPQTPRPRYITTEYGMGYRFG